MAVTVELGNMPKRVYKAYDGVYPEWSFMLVAVNKGADIVMLDRVTTALNAPGKRVRRIRSGNRIEGIIQGEREIPAGGVLVLDIRDPTSARVSPRSAMVGLQFVYSGERRLSVSHRVTLEPRITVYLRFPLAGRWTTINARTERHCIGGQFGFDFTAEQDLSLHQHPPEQQMTLEEFASFGQPIFAPVDGVIAACVDHQPDFPATPGKVIFPEGPTEENREQFLGNYAIIRTEQADCVLVFHLMRGSLRVRLGDHVREGQQIASVGNSGNTSGPHLHIEMLDGLPALSKLGTINLLQSGIPIGFKSAIRDRGGVVVSVENLVPQRWDILSREEPRAGCTPSCAGGSIVDLHC